MRRIITSALFVGLIFAALFARRPNSTDQNPPNTPSAAPAEGATRVGGPAFGTTYSVRWQATPGVGTKQVQAAVQTVITRVNGSMSTYHPDSELSRFNRAPAGSAAAALSPALSTVLEAALDVHRESGGAFDPTIGPLVRVWGFGPDSVVDPPSEQAQKAAAKLVGFDRLRYDPEAKSLGKSQDSMYVDLSAIAKGFAVDEVSRAVEALGLENHLVEIGGEVRARGESPSGRPWTVGIERPVTSARQIVQEAVPLADRSLATSGSYRNFVTKEGRRVTHILDPRTGQPVEHGLGSVSVVHKDCIAADAWATALYVLGADAGLALAEKRGLAALFLTVLDDGRLERKQTSGYAALTSE